MAQIVRIFTAEAATPDVADYSLALPPPNPVIRITCEASQSEFDGAQAFDVRGFVRDFGANIVASLAPINGSMNIAGSPWNTRNITFQFALPAAISGAAAAGGLVEIRGLLRVGAAIAGADVDFGSAEFVWVF